MSMGDWCSEGLLWIFRGEVTIGGDAGWFYQLDTNIEEEGSSVEGTPISDCPVSMTVWHLLD